MTDRTVLVAGGTSGINLGIARRFGATGPRELVHGERESFIGGYRWQRRGSAVGSPGLHVCGGDT
jgi:short-subunit dehydrogenase involved in D-alanine esterification of teichoic acids